jgi:hypothetical protein
MANGSSGASCLTALSPHRLADRGGFSFGDRQSWEQTVEIRWKVFSLIDGIVSDLSPTVLLSHDQPPSFH